MPETANGCVNDPGIDLVNFFPTETQFPHRCRPVVFHQNIRNGDQLSQNFLPFLRSEVQNHALLVAVETDEITAAVFSRLSHKGSELSRIVSAGRLDVDDLGAEIRQKHRCRGRCQDMAEIDNPDSFQSVPHRRSPAVVSDPFAGRSRRRSTGRHRFP